jgi:hypothetical protein
MIVANGKEDMNGDSLRFKTYTIRGLLGFVWEVRTWIITGPYVTPVRLDDSVRK